MIKKILLGTVGFAATLSEKALAKLEKLLDDDYFDKKAEEIYRRTKGFSEKKMEAVIREIQEIKESLRPANNEKIGRLKKRMDSLEKKLKEMAKD